VILINTCAVRERAIERVRGRASVLAQLKGRGKRVVLGITGCMAEHLRGELREQAPYVDLVVGPTATGACPSTSSGRARARWCKDTALDPHETYEGLDPSRAMTGSVIGHVAIQRGCDRFCTFCVVPFTRGREHASSPDEVVRQVRAMAAGGFREVQLLGQTVNSYRFPRAGARSASPICCARWRPWTASSASASSRPTRSASPRRSSRPWPSCPRCASTCTCRCSRPRTRCWSACDAAT
jgi:tRNA-2-methylthio-N6-dimethylallyladenosine synthase